MIRPLRLAPTIWDVVANLLVAASHWRIAVPFAAGITLAVLLARTLPGFDSAWALATAAAGLVTGILWQAHAEQADATQRCCPDAAPRPIARPVAALGLGFIGFIWGGVLTAMGASATQAALTLLLATAPVLIFRAFRLSLATSSLSLRLTVAALFVGFGLGRLLHGSFAPA